jgi:hypothetical protein
MAIAGVASAIVGVAAAKTAARMAADRQVEVFMTGSRRIVAVATVEVWMGLVYAQ